MKVRVPLKCKVYCCPNLAGIASGLKQLAKFFGGQAASCTIPPNVKALIGLWRGIVT